MKLLALIVFKLGHSEPMICSSAIDVSHVGFFQRSSAKEFIVFLARTVAKRVTGLRNQISQDAHVMYVYSTGGVAVVAVCDSEYNSRVAHTLATQVHTEFTAAFHGKYEGAEGMKDNFLPWPELERTLVRYQNPEETDKILRLKKDIEETKIVMHQAIDGVLERGEKIDNLVTKSEDLSTASKTFYKQAKKTNSSCCAIS